MTLAQISLWLCTYLVHSSLLLIGCYAIERLGLLKSRRLAEWSWRFAVFAGLLSATVQHSDLLERPWVSTAELPYASTNKMVSEPSSLKRTTHASDDILIDDNRRNQTTQKETQAPRAPQLETKALTARTELDSAPNTPLLQSRIKQIDLPEQLTFLLEYLAGLWLAYAVWCALASLFQITTINRQTRLLPSALDFTEKRTLHAVLRQLQLPSTQVRLSEQWSSPFVAPNKLICLPIKLIDTLSYDQLFAIVAHEQRHLMRRDTIWRIATHLVCRIFSFQVLNHIAQSRLNLLAEFDCDHFANRTPQARTEFCETLLWCVETSQQTKLPHLAVGMATSSALTQRFNLLLDENAMNTAFKKQNTWLSFGLLLLALATSALLIFGLPRFAQALPVSASAPIVAHKIQPQETHAIIKQSGDLSQNTMVPTPERSVHESVSSLTPSPKSVEAHQISVPIVMPSIASSADVERERERERDSEHKTTNTPLLPPSKTESQTLSVNQPEMDLLIQRAKKGDSEAQTELGEKLWYGEGAKVDHIAAKLWFEKAAAQGHPRAQAFLKMLHERDARKTEIAFFTNQFDGQQLKWSEDRCPLPKIEQLDQDRNVYPQIISTLEKSIECRNKYLSDVKTQLASRSIVPRDLQNLMTADELDQANERIHKVLIRNVQASREKAVTMVESIRERERKFITMGSLSYTNPNLSTYLNFQEQHGYQPDVLLPPTYKD